MMLWNGSSTGNQDSAQYTLRERDEREPRGHQHVSASSVEALCNKLCTLIGISYCEERALERDVEGRDNRAA
jgi:hypothetical protein